MPMPRNGRHAERPGKSLAGFLRPQFSRWPSYSGVPRRFANTTMSHLPVGWTVSNKDGSQAGPARRPSPGPEDDSGSEGDERGLDIAPDSPGWEDVEADEDEDLNVKCLVCSETYPAARRMLDHCSTIHGLDLLSAIKQHSLDFYGTIKLVNYIRSAANDGSKSLDTSTPELWKEDKYLQPMLENDALLFSLDDLIDNAADERNGKVPDYDDMEAAKVARAQKAELEDVAE